MELDVLKSRVKAILNEEGEDIALELSDDTVMLGDYIDRALPDAVAMLSTEGKAVNPKSASVSADNKGVISLPPDFISLVEIMATSWGRALSSTTPVNSPVYRRAMNPRTAPAKYSPICYRKGGNSLVALPVGSITSFVYNAALGTDFLGDEVAATAVCYMAAALVMSYFENEAAAQRLKNIAISYNQ